MKNTSSKAKFLLTESATLAIAADSDSDKFRGIAGFDRPTVGTITAIQLGTRQCEISGIGAARSRNPALANQLAG